MATKIIDFTPTPAAQRFSIALSGVNYVFRFYKSSRTQAWYLSIYDSADTPLLEGVRVVSLYPLLYRHTCNPLLSLYNLYALDTSGLTRPASGDLLGNDIKLYVTDG